MPIRDMSTVNSTCDGPGRSRDELESPESEGRWRAKVQPHVTPRPAIVGAETMHPFPSFMKSAANRIAPMAQHTANIEGYVFDGADGTQVAFWECNANANTEEHVHEFDEYFLVVEGSYIVTLDGKDIHLGPGQECVIPRGTRISGSVVAGTRTIHMFGGRRVVRSAGSR